MILYKLKDYDIKATIKEAKDNNKNRLLADGGGLQIAIKSNGSNVWEFRYTSPTKFKRRRTTIGTYPQVSLKEARNKAKEYKELITQDIDPIDHFKEQKEAIKQEQQGKFSLVVDEWLETQKHLNKKTYDTKISMFNNQVKPAFKNRLITTITHREIAELIEKTANKAPSMGKKMYSYFNQLFRYATTKGYIPLNIMVGNIDKRAIFKEQTQEHYAKITDIEIFKDLIKSIYSYNGLPSIKNALLFTLHIPLRASNIVGLKWEYVDFEKRVITIPRKEMKNSNINLPPCIMPLSDEVIRILKEQRKVSTSTIWIFSSIQSNKHINQETPNKALRIMGFTDKEKGKKQTMHSFRGTFRSLAETYQDEHKQSYEVKRVALDHHDNNKVELAYSHMANYEKGLRVLFNWWSDFVLKLKEN